MVNLMNTSARDCHGSDMGMSSQVRILPYLRLCHVVLSNSTQSNGTQTEGRSGACYLVSVVLGNPLQCQKSGVPDGRPNASQITAQHVTRFASQSEKLATCM